MDITFNRDAATTYYLDQQSIPLSAKVLMAPPSAKMWYQTEEVGLSGSCKSYGCFFIITVFFFGN